VVVLDLGDLAYSGTFPLDGEAVPTAPVRLASCPCCGLLQLAESPDPALMYGENYGYRSGLNASMVAHLTRKARGLERMLDLQPGDRVLDIGANDGTLLRAYSTPRLNRIAIDPTLRKWAEFYDRDDWIAQVPDFFTADLYWAVAPRPARLVTSVAMFYDLPDPVAFARDVASILADDGLWHVEVAYAPQMLRTGAYDGICHEHLEYYSLATLLGIADRAGLYAVDVSTNGTNGGSLAVTLAKKGSVRRRECDTTSHLLAAETRSGVNGPLAWAGFADTVRQRQRDLLGLLTTLRVNGRTISALGASTKGNILLQSSGIGTQLVDRIGEVNPDKFGRVTPGTGIPIVAEAEVLGARPDYLLVLPWHFREGLTARLSGYIADGGRVIYPLPDIEIVG
jgi:hypothetical protein